MERVDDYETNRRREVVAMESMILPAVLIVTTLGAMVLSMFSITVMDQ